MTFTDKQDFMKQHMDGWVEMVASMVARTSEWTQSRIESFQATEYTTDMTAFSDSTFRDYHHLLQQLETSFSKLAKDIFIVSENFQKALNQLQEQEEKYRRLLPSSRPN